MVTSLNSSSTALEEGGNGTERALNRCEPDSLPPAAEQQTEKQATAPATEGNAPNGGFRAWSVIFGAWCTSFCSFGWLNSIGVFQDYYESDLLKEYNTSTVSWIPSLQLFFMMALGPVFGAMYDRFSPRHLLFFGSVFHVFGLMMTSISHDYYQVLLSQGVCSAIGAAAIYQAVLNVVPGWFTTRSGAAFGVLTTGSSIGGVIFPIMVSHLIQEVGFGWAMRISAFLILFLLIISNLTVKANLPPQPKAITVKQFFAPFKEIQFVAVVMGFLLFTFGLYVPIDYIPVEAAAAGMSANLIPYLIPILNGASLFGRLLCGIAADKFGRYNVFVVVCYLSGIFILALWIPASTTAARIAFSCLFGFFSGAYLALFGALVAQISPASEIGLRNGITFLGCAWGSLTTNPISGAILEKSTGWLGPKLFAGIFCIAGTTCILAARIYKTGWNLMAVY